MFMDDGQYVDIAIHMNMCVHIYAIKMNVNILVYFDRYIHMVYLGTARGAGHIPGRERETNMSLKRTQQFLYVICYWYYILWW